MGRWLQFTGRGYHDGGQRAVKNTGTHVTRRHRSGAQVCRPCTFSTLRPRRGRSVRCHHLERVAGLQAWRRGRRTTAGEAQQPCRQAHGRSEGSCRSEGREGRRRGRAPEGRGRPRPGQVSGHPPWCADEDVLRWFILVVALLLDPAAVRRVSGRPSCCEALLRLRRRRTLARLEAHGEATSSGWIHRQSQTSPALRRAQGLLTSTA